MREKKLNINFFVQFVYKQGTYFRFHNLAIGLQQLGHNVTIWGCDYSKQSDEQIEENRDGVNYIISSGNKLQSIFGQPSHPFTSYKRSKIKYPYANVNHMFQPFLSGAWSWFKNMKNADLNVYDWDDLWTGGIYSTKTSSIAEYWSRFWVKKIENTFPSKADMVTVCSDFLKNRAIKQQAKNVEVIYNGYWPIDLPDKKQAREIFGLDKQAIYFGFMGRTHAEIDWCYDGMREVIKKNDSIRLAICGSEAYILDNLEPELKDKIDYLGMLTPEKADMFACAIDIGLLPLQDEPFNQSRFPIKLANYQAMGTIVLYSDIGQSGIVGRSLPWNINAGKTKETWLKAFEESEKKLLDNNLAQINFTVLEKELSWLNISKKLEQAYFKHLNKDSN